MFYARFIGLCTENNEKPTALMESLGSSRSLASKWKKEFERGNDTLPDFSTLLAIARHFRVSVEYLATGEQANLVQLTPEEKCILDCFRKADERDKNTVRNVLERYEQDTASAAG